MSREYRTYLRRVEKLLYCPWRDRARLMAEWRRELEEAHPDVSGWTQGELLEWIGQPEDIAQELQAALPQWKVGGFARQSRWGMWLGIALGGLALALVIGYIIWWNTHDVYYYDEEVVIISEWREEAE